MVFGWLKSVFAPVQRGRIEIDGRVIDNDTEIIGKTKVVGVTKKNDDGRSRQKIIARLKPGQILALIPEPDNPYDSKAIAVLCDGKQIGYLSKDRAKEFEPRARKRGHLFAVVTDITGGDAAGGRPTYGVNIAILNA